MIKVFDLVYGRNISDGAGNPKKSIREQVEEILKDNPNYEIAELLELKSNWGSGSENYKLTVNIVEDIFEKASLIVHQRFCHELVEHAKRHPDKIPREVPSGLKILDAINLLEELYPNLKRK